MWRTAGSPIMPASFASTGACSCTTGEVCTSTCARHRADGDRAAGKLDPGKALDLRQVDQLRRPGEPQLHGRQQRVAAGEDLGVLDSWLSMLRRLPQRLRAVEGKAVHCGSPVSLEPHAARGGAPCRLSGSPPTPSAASPAWRVFGADRVGDGVDDGGGRRDRAGLAAALDAERVRRASGHGGVDLQRRQIVGARHA